MNIIVMSKIHTKLFYRAVARIRAIGANPGMVALDRLQKVLKIGISRAIKLKDELVEAGALRAWDISKKDDGKRGNILWENMSKFRVPKKITQKERDRVKEEFRQGKLPMKAGDLFK